MRRRATLPRSLAAAGCTTLLLTACMSQGAHDPLAGPETAKTTIEIMFGFGGDQTQGFKDSLNPWAQSQGITIEYTQSSNFETLIQTRVRGGDVPDIAIFPQPGILQQIAATGALAPLDSQIDLPKLEKTILPGFLEATTYDGKVYGAPVGMNVKSLYWYDKKQFADHGFKEPKTHAELKALIDKIKATGKAALCVGLESGPATGWPGTDWIEDYVLQTSGPEVYDKWVKNEVKFNSPDVRKAFDVYQDLVLTDGNTFGGPQSIVSTPFGTALNPMFEADPGCYIGKQGNFITQKGFFPTAVFQNLDTRVGVFATPPMKAGDTAMLVGGDSAAVFTGQDTNVKKVMEKITNDPTFGAPWAKTGGFLSPHRTFDGSAYPNQTLQRIAKLAQDAKTARFDGSDQMPGAVGAGTFWRAMTAWTSGQDGLDEVLTMMDDSWPAQD